MAAESNAGWPAESRTTSFVGRTWALDAAGDWLAGDSRALLVLGEPGIGKTAFADHLVQIANGTAPARGALRRGWLNAVHFCQQHRQETLTPNRIMEGLATQLANTLPGYKDLVEQWRQRPISVDIKVEQRVGDMVNSTMTGVALHLGELEPRQAFDEVLRAPLGALREQHGWNGDVVVLVDALDETTEGAHGPTWAALLAREIGQNPPPGLRVLVTSRPGTAADELNRCLESDLRTVNLLADQPPGIDDVAAYVHERLRGVPAPGGPALARRVAAASRGNFLYATYVINDILALEPRPHDLASLPLPSGLVDIYRRFLYRAIAEDRSAWERRFRPVLGALVQSGSNGLTREQLVIITGLAASEVDDTLHASMPYLRVCEGSTKTYRPYHQSLRDFLRQPGDLHIYPAEADARIAGRLTAAYAGRWQDCLYLLENLATHVAAAVAAAPASVATPLDALADPSFLKARAETAGVRAALADYGRVLDVLSDPPAELVFLRQAIRRQAHHLDDLDIREKPVFLLQQVLYEAIATGEPELAAVIVDCLTSVKAGYLRTRWATYSDSFQLSHNLVSHHGVVNAVAINATGTVAVSAGAGGRPQVWDLTTGALIRELTGQPGRVRALTITPDQSRIVAGCDDTVAIWDLATGELLRTLKGHTKNVVAVVATGNEIVTAFDDKTARVWGLGSGELLRTLHHADKVVAVAVTADGDRLVTVSDDATVRLWYLDRDRVPPKVAGLPPRVRPRPRDAIAATFAADGRRVLIAIGDDWYAWNLVAPQVEPFPVEKLLATTAISFRPDGAFGIRGSAHTVAEVLDLTSAQQVHQLSGHTGTVTCAAITPDARHAITGSADDTVKVWDLSVKHRPQALAGHTHWVSGLVADPNRGSVVSASGDGTVRAWDIRSGKAIYRITNVGRAVFPIAGGWAATSSYAGQSSHTVGVWELSSGRKLMTLDGVQNEVLAVDPNATVAIAGSAHRGDPTAQVWDLRTGRLLHTLSGHTGRVRFAEVTPDGRYAVTVSDGSNRNDAMVWDLATGRLVHRLPGGRSIDCGATVTPDGSKVIFGADKTRSVWDLASGRLLYKLTDDARRQFESVTTSDSTQAIIATERDNAIHVWDLRTGSRLLTLKGHTSSPYTAAVSPQGAYLATGSWDDVIRIWDLDTGRCLACFAAHHTVSHIAWVSESPIELVVGTTGGDLICLNWAGIRKPVIAHGSPETW